jgi:hypothetical protein
MRYEVERLARDPTQAGILLGEAENLEAALAIAMHATDKFHGGVQIVEQSQDSRKLVMRYNPEPGGLSAG